MYEPRTYRHWVKGKDLVSFGIIVEETDLYICASTNLKRTAIKLVTTYRDQLKRYIEQHPDFQTSLEPLPVNDGAPSIVKAMAESTSKVGVGPMASVAGAIAEFVGTELLNLSSEVIIENGGDIYLKSLRRRQIGIYAGKSPFTGTVGLEIEAEDTPLGVCTSSGTVGHSLSYGNADAVIAIAGSAILADAAATAIANLIRQPSDFPHGIKFAEEIEGLRGVVMIQDDNMGLWGEVKICSMSS
jgi:ApbE superfamily uncharacterized protein (UPF0280 family)